MWRHIASNALTFLVVAVFLVGGVLIWAKSEYDNPGPLAQAICLDVPRGTTTPATFWFGFGVICRIAIDGIGRR